MEDIPASRLAEMPASQWEEAKRRIAVVRRYIREGDNSMATSAKYEASLGLRRGMFHRLVRMVKSWDSAPERTRLRPRQAPSDVVAEAAAREAVKRAGLSATLEEAINTAIVIAAERGSRPPTMRALTHAYGSVPASSGIASRLGLTGDFAFDASAMAVRVMQEDRTCALAVVTAIVDAQSGRFASWRVTAGAPTPMLAKSMLAELPPKAAGISMTLPSGMLSGFRSLMEEHGASLTADRITPGTIIRAAIGARLGRIAILPRLLTRGGGDDLPVVDLADLTGVVSELLTVIGITDHDG